MIFQGYVVNIKINVAQEHVLKYGSTEVEILPYFRKYESTTYGVWKYFRKYT
jgi:hypothetical protein